MLTIYSSVSNRGQNILSDVITVQYPVNKNLKHLGVLLPLKTGDTSDSVTIGSEVGVFLSRKDIISQLNSNSILQP